MDEMSIRLKVALKNNISLADPSKVKMMRWAVILGARYVVFFAMANAGDQRACSGSLLLMCRVTREDDVEGRWLAVLAFVV